MKCGNLNGISDDVKACCVDVTARGAPSCPSDKCKTLISAESVPGCAMAGDPEKYGYL